MSTSSSADVSNDLPNPASRGELSCPDIRVDQYRSSIRIASLGREPLVLQLVDIECLRKHLTGFTEQAESIRPSGLPVDPSTAQTFLLSAKRMAYHCLVDCTVENNKTRRKALKLFTDAIRTSLIRDRPLTVEIFNRGGEYLPWEWLGYLDSQADYDAEAKSVLGFTAVVYRRDASETDSTIDGRFLAAQPLRLRFFRHAGLPATEFESRFFSLSGLFRLLGPLPASGGELALAEQLANPFHSAPDAPDQVVHLSCDHETEKDPVELRAHELAMLESRLSFGDDERLAVNVRTLERDLADAEASDEVEKPLVFFNGCRGDFYPFANESVAGVLLRNCNRAVVSTAMRVPDAVAAEFGRFYYERLLDGRMSAEALLRAKWDLLITRGSPLGLLYTYYGRPDLRVAPRVTLPPSWRFPAGAQGWCA